MPYPGIPLFLLEMAIGQYSSSGVINVWRLCPLFRGMGVAMVVISGIIAPYYNMIIAWAMIFLCESFTSQLPWYVFFITVTIITVTNIIMKIETK